jgi:DNA polymerase-3 subunit epsilon
MIREIVLDTETTGLSPFEGHRIVEIGALELINHVPSGQTFHTYLNPERDMPKEAEAVHGLTAAFLKDKPVFRDIAQAFSDFLADSLLVIHNASFDITFLNAELDRIGFAALEMGRVVDTLQIAKKRHPMASNSLDALCKRYGIDLSRREKHGALLDSELLADVYLELIGGRQTAFSLASQSTTKQAHQNATHTPLTPMSRMARPRPLAARLTAAEQEAHAAMLKELGPTAAWLKTD